MGHTLEVFASPGALLVVVCTRCGAFGEALPRGLSAPCSGICKPGALVRLERLRKDARHPRGDRVDDERRFHRVDAEDALPSMQVLLDYVEPAPRLFARGSGTGNTGRRQCRS